MAFKFRGKRDEPAWRARWDWALFIGGFVPALIFGVAMGNVLRGVPFRFNPDMHIFYDGTFFGLLNPFALLCGLVSVAMLAMHGAAWLQLKTQGPVAQRARRYGSVAAVATMVLYALAGFALWEFVDGYRVTSALPADGPSNPMLKTVEVHSSAWFANYEAHPWLYVVPGLGLAGALVALLGLRMRAELMTFVASALSIAGIILSVGVSMFPFILPSTIDPRASLTVFDSSSSHLTLFIMLVVTAIFIPIIVAYTSWVLRRAARQGRRRRDQRRPRPRLLVTERESDHVVLRLDPGTAARRDLRGAECDVVRADGRRGRKARQARQAAAAAIPWAASGPWTRLSVGP